MATSGFDNALSFVLLSGSERNGGNTDMVVEEISRTLSERGVKTNTLRLMNYRITPCGTCGDCNLKADRCDIADDMPELVARMQEADALIYAVPVHGFGMAHPMQVFIERAGVGYLRFNRPLANKVAGAIVTGRRYSHMAVYNQLLNNFLLNRMIVVGSGYPAIVHGGRPGKALNDEEGMGAVRALIDRMLGLAGLLKRYNPVDIASYLTLGTVNERELRAAPRHRSSPEVSLPTNHVAVKSRAIPD